MESTLQAGVSIVFPSSFSLRKRANSPIFNLFVWIIWLLSSHLLPNFPFHFPTDPVLQFLYTLNPSFICRSIARLFGSSTRLPQTMDSSVKKMTERIFHKLGSHCAPHGRGETSPKQMMQISKTLGQRFKVVHRDGLGEGKSHWAALMQKLLQSGHPVLVSRKTSELQAHHYVVVTRIRRSFKYYSFCDEQTDECTPWTLREESNLYVHEEDKLGKWESNEINFLATITGNWKHSRK